MLEEGTNPFDYVPQTLKTSQDTIPILEWCEWVWKSQEALVLFLAITMRAFKTNCVYLNQHAFNTLIKLSRPPQFKNHKHSLLHRWCLQFSPCRVAGRGFEDKLQDLVNFSDTQFPQIAKDRSQIKSNVLDNDSITTIQKWMVVTLLKAFCPL